MKSEHWLIVLNIAWISSAVVAGLTAMPQLIIAPAVATVTFIIAAAMSDGVVKND